MRKSEEAVGGLLDIVERLKKALEGDENVLLAYLFGSRASGKASLISDFDLAVLLKDSSLQALSRLLSRVTEALGVSEDRIDILDLGRAPLHLKAKVLSEGVKIVDRGFEDVLRLEVNTKYPEIAPQIDYLLRKWVSDPDSLDLRVIKDRLDYLAQLREHLETFFKRHKLGDLKEDFEAWYALKAMVQDSIQAMIDVCAHVFSSKNLGIATSCMDYIRKLAEKGYMDSSLAENLRLAITLRNRLVHRYLAVEVEELWGFVTKLVREIIPRFREWVLKIAQTNNQYTEVSP